MLLSVPKWLIIAFLIVSLCGKQPAAVPVSTEGLFEPTSEENFDEALATIHDDLSQENITEDDQSENNELDVSEENLEDPDVKTDEAEQTDESGFGLIEPDHPNEEIEAVNQNEGEVTESDEDDETTTTEINDTDDITTEPDQTNEEEVDEEQQTEENDSDVLEVGAHTIIEDTLENDDQITTESSEDVSHDEVTDDDAEVINSEPHEDTKLSGCDDPSHKHQHHDPESQHREHMEWNAKQITELMKRLTHMLEAPTADWNEYRYITALRGPDGSLYVPHHHGQSTRKHLATLLGFADEIIVSKNALASSDSEDRESGDNNEQQEEPEITKSTEEHVEAHKSDSTDGVEKNSEAEEENTTTTQSVFVPTTNHTAALDEEITEANTTLETNPDINPQIIERFVNVVENISKYFENTELTGDGLMKLLQDPAVFENITKSLVDDVETLKETNPEKVAEILIESAIRLGQKHMLENHDFLSAFENKFAEQTDHSDDKIHGHAEETSQRETL